MQWSKDDVDDDRPLARQAKVCSSCGKIILRLDDLVRRRDRRTRVETVLCSECAAEADHAH